MFVLHIWRLSLYWERGSLLPFTFEWRYAPRCNF